MASIVVTTIISMAVSYAAFYIAAKIAGKSKLKMPDASNYPIQASMKGIPIQKVYGTTRIAGNVIWLGSLNPYTVEHDTGGKGGGQSPTMEETKYKRSFMVSLGEGPMSVTRIWANNKLIWPYNEEGLVSPRYIATIRSANPYYLTAADVTIFEGLDNSGVTSLTGLEYGEYPNDTLLFFNEYDLGNGTALPNIVAEVSTGVSQYLVGCHFAVGSDQPIVWKVRSDGTLKTDWADGGKWHYDSGYAAGTTTTCYDILQLTDGRMLVAHNELWIDEANIGAGGKQVAVTMLDEDGNIDTSWGYNGHFVHLATGVSYDILDPRKLIPDNKGNIILLAHGGYNLQKFDSNGTRLWAKRWYDGPYNRHGNYLYDGIWTDAGCSRLLVVQSAEQCPSGDKANMIAIDPETGDIDTDWAGNINEPGYGYFEAPNGSGSHDLYEILKSGAGYLVRTNQDTSDGSLLKVLADGSNLDASFGTAGAVEAGSETYKVVLDGEDILTLGRYDFDGVEEPYTNTVRRFDKNGNLLDSYDFVGVGYDTYHDMAVIGGSLFFANDGSTPSNFYFERWTKGFEYIDGFDPSGYSAVSWATIVRSNAYDRDAIDCNPAYIINDLVTNTRYGGRLASARICDDCLQSAEDYWDSINALISIKIDESKPWQDWVDFILAHCGGSRNFDGGKLHIRPFRDEDSQFTLTDDNIVQTNPKKPVPKVQILKRPYSETFNRIEVVWTDRENGYDTAVAIANDEVDQRISGQIRKKTFDLKGIHDADLAAYMAQRLLIDSMYRFNIYKFTVTYENMRIELGDVGTLTCEDITGDKIRVMKKEESAHGRNIKIVAMEEYSQLYPDLSIINYQNQSNQTSEADAITFEDSEINFLEDIIEQKLYLSVVPGAADVNGWLVYKSYDDISYDLLGRCGIGGVTGGDASSAGTLQSYMPSHPAVTWSPTETILVDIGTVTDLHTDTTDEQFWNDRRLAKIGDEIISFRDAEETATPGIWQLSFIRRGIFGTAPVAHYSGESFCTLNNDYTYKFPATDIGKTVYFKAVAFYGDIIQDISTVTAYSVTVGGYADRPAAASLLRLTSDENDGGVHQYSGSSFTLYWNLGSRVSGFNYGDWINLPWGNYTADDDLQKVVLKFEQTDGTEIGSREIAVGSSATITKATDLGGYDRAVIKVVPRRATESRLENSILVESI